MSHIKSKRTGKSTGRRKISRGKGFAGLEYLENRRVLATFTVTNLADGPVAASGDLPGSLRQAIYDANALSGSDDIVFDSQAAGFLPLTDGPLNIRDSVTITGPGPFDLTIGGGLQSRIFDINDLDFFNHSDVSISGMTLTAGSTGLEGGAIRTTESLEIRDVILAGNESLGAGGAIAVIEEIPVADAAMGLDAVELTIVDSSISGNTGADGGGVAVSAFAADVTIINSQITGNSAANTGGGLSVQTYSGATYISDSLFAGNESADGGGVFLSSEESGSNLLDNLVVSANSATGRGGGVFVSNKLAAVTTISNTSVTGNTAGEGGGIYSANGKDFAGGGFTQVYQSTIDSNYSDSAGGGIHAENAEDGQLEIVRSTISGNQAGSDGGGMQTVSRRYGQYEYYYYPYVYVPYDPATGSGGYGIGPYGPYDYYITGRPGKTTVRETTISGNTAVGLGGGVNSDAYSFGSSAYVYGLYDTTLEFVNATVSGNNGSTGGGLYFDSFDYQGAIVNIEHSTFTGNTGVGVGGIEGDLTGFPFAYARVSNSIIAENLGSEPDVDGGVYASYSLIGAKDSLSNGMYGNVVGTIVSPVDPLLGPLAMNRGPTRTHALLAGSPAINSADPAPASPPDYDQRGIPRLLDGRSDMGAFEVIDGIVSFAGNGDLVIDTTDVDDEVFVNPGRVAGEVEVLLFNQHVGFYTPTNRIIINLYDGDDFARIDESLTYASVMRAGNGLDTLVGGGGPDKLIGNADADSLRGRSGDDILIGGSGPDELLGGTGEDQINGGSGSDHIEGNADDDVLVGSAGNDELLGGGGDDDLLGGDGNDVLDGGGGDDTMFGGADDDILVGGFGTDSLTGGADSDILIGGDGLDTLTGSNGEDILIGGTTSHDSDSAALQAILNEWSDLSIPYLDRIANIRAGAPGFAFMAGTSVFSDGIADSLTGNAGLDWYFDVSTEDALIGVGGNEVVDATLPDTSRMDNRYGMYGGGLDSNTTGRRNDGTQPISVMPLHIMGMKHWGEDDE